MPARIPDVHCHLASLPEPERAVEEALAAGVGPILTVGMDRASSEQGLHLRRRFPGDVLAGVGLHPSTIPGLGEAELRRELDFVRRTLAEADVLGEVGLDYKDARDDMQRARQRQALTMQLGWAAEKAKPINMHCRRAERDVFEAASAFARRTGLGADLHWFTHSAKLARACAAAGLFISVGPSILHDEAQARVAAAIDAGGLLLETDSPVEYDGREARPVWAVRVAERLADLRGETLDDLATRLQANLRRYLAGPAASGSGSGARSRSARRV